VHASFNVTTTIGFAALFANTTGTANTATGVGALQSNNADRSTAIGKA